MVLSPQPPTNENYESLVESSVTRLTNSIEDVEEFTNNDFFDLNYPPMGSAVNLSDDHEINSSNTSNDEEDDEDEDDGDADEDDGGEVVASPNTTNNPDGNVNVVDIVKLAGPKKGMLFDSVDSLENFYREHGRLKGFGIPKRSSGRRNKYATIICDRGRKSRAVKASKRIGCRAKVNVVFRDYGKWQVTMVICRHNHTIDPLLSRFIRVHRTVSKHTKRALDTNDICGAMPSGSTRMLEVQSGGLENVGCLTKDMRNYIDSTHRLNLGDGDANSICTLFARLQSDDGDFFHSYKLDDVGRLLHVMWVHPRGRTAYQDFHDVVTFDTTYLVNHYDMPFATVLGVNQHDQSILLGCALLSTKHSESFVWLFTTWLQAMDNIHLNAIITDQCESIRKTVRKVMPKTRHRFCMWHIMCKVPEKLKEIDDPEAVRNEFKVVVYDSMSIPIFEENWNNYVINHYDMPFATVLGVNQHDQSILLGCALLSTEHSESFVWLFTTWLQAMDNIHLNAIITDQCESIRKTVRKVMPKTRHRFCMWHIMCKVPEKLKEIDDPEAVRNEFKVVVYDSMSIPIFEENWNNYVIKHGL